MKWQERHKVIFVVVGTGVAVLLYLGWRGNQVCVPEGVLMELYGSEIENLRRFIVEEVDKDIVGVISGSNRDGRREYEDIKEHLREIPEILEVSIDPVVWSKRGSSIGFGSFEFVRLGFFNGYSNRKVFGGWVLLPNGCHLHVTRYVERIKGKRKEWYLEIYFDTNAVVRKLMRGSKGGGEKDG